jgi:hypothetical protein
MQSEEKIPVHHSKVQFKDTEEVPVNESTGKQVYSGICGVWNYVNDVTYGT